jgi:hypothetical protein
MTAGVAFEEVQQHDPCYKSSDEFQQVLKHYTARKKSQAEGSGEIVLNVSIS